MTQQLASHSRMTADGSERFGSTDIAVARGIAKSLAESLDDIDRHSVAQAFGLQLVTNWWQALAERHSNLGALREPLAPVKCLGLPMAAEMLASQVGRAIGQLEVEVAAYEIGRFYTAMLPPKYRSAFGVHYTPPKLTARLIAQATEAGVDWTCCRVLDPACGGGAFLAPVARQIVQALPKCSRKILVENVATRLRGYEIDPFGAWLSQVTVDAVLAPIAYRAKRPLPLVVTVCDSLKHVPPRETFDLVIGNPPYGRVRLDTAERVRFKRSLFGHANLYGLFTDVALDHVKPGGVVAYVTPTSFLAGEYFKNLRKLLGYEAPPVSIDFVSMRKGVFEDVLQETLLAAYRRSINGKCTNVSEIMPINGIDLNIRPVGRFSLPKIKSQPWLLPRNEAQARLVHLLGKMKHRLSDWGYGVSTGPLVWNRHKPQIVSNPGENCYPLIWAEAVTSDGRFVWRAQKKHHLPYFQFRTGDDWLIVNTPCVLLQRTTAKEQRRRLIAATLPESFLDQHGSVVIENHLNMVRPVSKVPPVPADVLAVFLNSPAADRAFRCVSGSVAVSAYELEALPLPAPDDLNDLLGLVQAGASRDELDAECARLYGNTV